MGSLGFMCDQHFGVGLGRRACRFGRFLSSSFDLHLLHRLGDHDFFHDLADGPVGPELPERTEHRAQIIGQVGPLLAFGVKLLQTIGRRGAPRAPSGLPRQTESLGEAPSVRAKTPGGSQENGKNVPFTAS